MGRRRIPTALHRLRGYPGKRRRRREPEPLQPSATELRPPRWLDAVARAEWRRLEPELVRLGLLTVLDLTKFSAYCRWYARWRRCERSLTAREEMTCRTKSGYLQQNPLLAIARTSAEMADKFGSQFGLSPTNRVTLGLPLDPTAPQHDRPGGPPRPPRDEFEEFLKRNRSRTTDKEQHT